MQDNKNHIYMLLTVLVLLFSNCLSMRVYDSSKTMGDSVDNVGYTVSFFGFELNMQNNLICENGIYETKLERNFLGGFLDIYGILPYYLNVRKATTACALVTSSGVSKSTPAKNSGDFTDIVVLKNGDILDNVKTIVTAKELIVTDANGNTTVYPKKEILSVKKKK